MSEPLQAQFIPDHVEPELCLQLYKALRQLQTEKESFRIELRTDTAKQLKKFKNRYKKTALRRASQQAQREYQDKISQAAQLYKKTVLLANQDCLALCFKISRQIIGEHLPLSDKFIAKSVRAALQNLAVNSEALLKVNPEQRQNIEQELMQLDWPVRIKSDAKISAGQAMLEVPAGQIKIDWRTGFEQLKQNLWKELEKCWSEKCCC